MKTFEQFQIKENIESAVRAHNYNVYARKHGKTETGRQLYSMGKPIQPIEGKDIEVGKEPEGYSRDKQTGKIEKIETQQQQDINKQKAQDALSKAMGYGKGRYQGD